MSLSTLKYPSSGIVYCISLLFLSSSILGRSLDLGQTSHCLVLSIYQSPIYTQKQPGDSIISKGFMNWRSSGIELFSMRLSREISSLSVTTSNLELQKNGDMGRNFNIKIEITCYDQRVIDDSLTVIRNAIYYSIEPYLHSPTLNHHTIKHQPIATIMLP